MKKNLRKTVIILFVSLIYSLIIEKFFYPETPFEFKRFTIDFLTLGLFLYNFLTILNKKNIKLLIKVIFSTLVLIIASLYYKNTYYFSFGVTEVFLITYLAGVIANKRPRLGLVINDILFLLLNIQIIVLIFSGTFVKLIMLTNLNSLEDLSGKAFIYGLGVLGILLFSFIPVKKVVAKKNKKKLFLITLVLEMLLVVLIKLPFSPMGNYPLLANEEITYYKNVRELEKKRVDKKVFYNKKIDSYIDTDYNSENRPNVILIFTEGLSQNVIDDEREITPNISAYQKESLTFTGYYNHTFATYRGLVGQLYSGYQYDNLDANYLISIQDILRDKGYNTTFINTEPKNKDFTKYLKSFDFDKLITSKKRNGKSKTVSDKDAYSLLFKTAKKLNKKKKPFFLSIYTFGTHVSLDSPDIKYGNGEDSFLNKFHNADYYFGQFMENYENSSLFDNTIIFFTGDHCTYADMDYKRVFPDYSRLYTTLDFVPLFIYHKGIEANSIEVNGRNSLDLAPTLLDYIDVSAPNYFLGESLFSGADKGSDFDHYFHDDINWVTTFDKKMVFHKEELDQKTVKRIEDYLSVSSKKPKKDRKN